MVQLKATQIPSVLLMLVGGLVILNAFIANPYPGFQEYNHSIHSVEDVPQDAPEFSYANLSSNAQDAFSKTLAAEEKRATVYGSWNEPQEFQYTDVVRTYSIEYQGERYALQTYGGGWQSLEFIFFLGMVVIGLGLVLVGLRGYRTENPQMSAAVLVGVVAFWSANQLGISRSFPNTQLALILLALITVAPALVTWLALEWYE